MTCNKAPSLSVLFLPSQYAGKTSEIQPREKKPPSKYRRVPTYIYTYIHTTYIPSRPLCHLQHLYLTQILHVHVSKSYLTQFAPFPFPYHSTIRTRGLKRHWKPLPWPLALYRCPILRQLAHRSELLLPSPA